MKGKTNCVGCDAKNPPFGRPERRCCGQHQPFPRTRVRFVSREWIALIDNSFFFCSFFFFTCQFACPCLCRFFSLNNQTHNARNPNYLWEEIFSLNYQVPNSTGNWHRIPFSFRLQPITCRVKRSKGFYEASECKKKTANEKMAKSTELNYCETTGNCTFRKKKNM